MYRVSRLLCINSPPDSGGAALEVVRLFALRYIGGSETIPGRFPLFLPTSLIINHFTPFHTVTVITVFFQF